MLRNFELSAIADSDPAVELAVNQHIKRAIGDCDDRPGDAKARKVTLVISMVPITDQSGNADEVKISYQIKSSVPDHVSRDISCKIKQGAKLVFNDLSTDNVNQKTID